MGSPADTMPIGAAVLQRKGAPEKKHFYLQDFILFKADENTRIFFQSLNHVSLEFKGTSHLNWRRLKPNSGFFKKKNEEHF